MIRLKVNFRIEVDDDGYPPVSVESLWVIVRDGNYIVDSIPFFTHKVSVGDEICADLDSENNLWYKSTLKRSKNSLIRIIVFKIDNFINIIDEFRKVGCGVEGMKKFKLIALDIPRSVDIADVQRILIAKSTSGELDYEEPILRQ